MILNKHQTKLESSDRYVAQILPDLDVPELSTAFLLRRPKTLDRRCQCRPKLSTDCSHLEEAAKSQGLKKMSSLDQH